MGLTNRIQVINNQPEEKSNKTNHSVQISPTHPLIPNGRKALREQKLRQLKKTALNEDFKARKLDKSQGLKNTLHILQNPKDQYMDGNIDFTCVGPLHPLMLDNEVSEIMVNGPTQVYCVRKGKICLTSIQFRDNEHVMRVIEQIAVFLGCTVDGNSPFVNALLPDGSRVNAMIPPLVLNSPTMIITKF